MSEDYDVKVDTNIHPAVAMETLADAGGFGVDLGITSSVSPTSPTERDNATVLASAHYPRAMHCNAAGTVKIMPPGSATAVSITVLSGVTYPYSAKQVIASGTTLTTAQIILIR